MKINRNSLGKLAFVSALLAAPHSASAGEALFEALKSGKLWIDERYRYEYVDQDGIAEEANASTLRSRIGWKSGSFYGLTSGVEFEAVTNVGGDEFNNTINGKTQFPVVADVKSHELNQLYLQYAGIPGTVIKGGRQVIVVDNHRFVGHVGWRQNNQTFDAGIVKNTSIPGLTLTYGYIEGVNRIFGNDSVQGDWDSDSHILHAAYKINGVGVVKGYGYLFDFENDAIPAANNVALLNSVATYGVSFSGKRDYAGYGLHYYAEYAHQEDYGDNPVSFDADYYHLSLGLSKSGLKTTVGYEVLGADDDSTGRFRTPLATLHKFNGFADKFLVTPVNGLEDFYIDVTYKVKNAPGQLSIFNGLLLKAQYHEFKSEEGSIDYGTEIDFYAKMPLRRGVYVEAKYANYDADQFATDTEKFTLGVGWKY